MTSAHSFAFHKFIFNSIGKFLESNHCNIHHFIIESELRMEQWMHVAQLHNNNNRWPVTNMNVFLGLHSKRLILRLKRQTFRKIRRCIKLTKNRPYISKVICCSNNRSSQWHITADWVPFFLFTRTRWQLLVRNYIRSFGSTARVRARESEQNNNISTINKNEWPRTRYGQVLLLGNYSFGEKAAHSCIKNRIRNVRRVRLRRAREKKIVHICMKNKMINGEHSMENHNNTIEEM